MRTADGGRSVTVKRLPRREAGGRDDIDRRIRELDAELDRQAAQEVRP